MEIPLELDGAATGLSLAVLFAEGVLKRASDHPATPFAAIVLLAAGITVLGVGACRQGKPIIDPGPRPPTADGTIGGTVRGPAGSTPIEGRTVEAVNLETGERDRAVTNNAGGFSFKLKPGRYRIELVLLDGETLIKKPDIIHLNRSDVDAHADFVVGSSRVVRPRFAVPRADNGLGSPIA